MLDAVPPPPTAGMPCRRVHLDDPGVRSHLAQEAARAATDEAWQSGAPYDLDELLDRAVELCDLLRASPAPSPELVRWAVEAVGVPARLLRGSSPLLARNPVRDWVAFGVREAVSSTVRYGVPPDVVQADRAAALAEEAERDDLLGAVPTIRLPFGAPPLEAR